MNSYTIPLNRQELRHASYQGAFKFFVVNLSHKYAQALKNLDVFAEKKLSRMADAAFFGDLIVSLEEGIVSASEAKIDDLYRKYDNGFPHANATQMRVDTALRRVFEWKELHGTALMKPSQFHSLLLAITHREQPVPTLLAAYPLEQPGEIDDMIAVANLSLLAEVLSRPIGEVDVRFRAFAEASAGTNRVNQRRDRFQTLSRALEPKLL
jgi:hypothetical protein